MKAQGNPCIVRATSADDFPGIIALTGRVYPDSPPWSDRQLASHLAVFPEGQFVAEDPESGTIIGMAASLIIIWDDYTYTDSWRDFTDTGMFTNHDPVRGRTLYGAEVMVDPACQGKGIGSALYRRRRQFAEDQGVLRIRAGARLRGYHRYASTMTARDYVDQVLAGTLDDPTLGFQIRRGFHVLDVIPGYLRHDVESLGWAAVIEWINPAVAGNLPAKQSSRRTALPDD
ncbi:MAG: GNAT family N-acetyltransferase [Gemmatimonadota bacterium]